MICANCRAPVTGYPPDHLRSSGRCQKCYPAYLAEQQLKNSKKVEIDKEKQKVKEKIAEEEQIDNRFDILDM